MPASVSASVALEQAGEIVRLKRRNENLLAKIANMRGVMILPADPANPNDVVVCTYCCDTGRVGYWKLGQPESHEIGCPFTPPQS